MHYRRKHKRFGCGLVLKSAPLEELFKFETIGKNPFEKTQNPSNV